MMNNRKIKRLAKPALLLVLVLTLVSSCEEFFHPDQALIIMEDDFHKTWNEYRSAEMGLYSLQQELVEQLVVLGELRGDLLEITDGADNDLKEIYNFSISSGNKYASPNNFYMLIAACNNLALKLESEIPEVLDKSAPETQYDRLYGEVLCMRAWTYFTAVKIYGEVPYIWPSLTSADEINAYLQSPQTYYDVSEIIYSIDGHNNDTITHDTIILERALVNMPMVIDTFTRQLPDRIKAVGVVHNLDNGDQTWDVTVWNTGAYRALMGEMHLFNSNLGEAYSYFSPILNFNDPGASGIKYGLDNKFSYDRWISIFEGVEVDEHLLTLKFDKSYQQQHSLQTLFSVQSPNQYMLKPTRIAIENWETIWSETDIRKNASNPEQTYMAQKGVPGDFYRGNMVSYAYMRGSEMLTNDEVRRILSLKSIGNDREVEILSKGVDTVVYKYSINKDIFDHDANFILYRASAIHLYAAEIYAYWLHDVNGNLNTDVNKSLKLLNNGAYKDPPDGSQMGVRGRVGFGSADDAIYIENQIYQHDPYSNEITGYLDFTSDLPGKQAYLEDQIITERARELAFEGMRFYDLMRISKKRGDPSYLADKVAAKFSGAKAEQIRQHLMDEANWYVPLPEVTNWSEDLPE